MTTQAPTFKQPLQSVVVLEGSTATFEAHISGKLTRAHLPTPRLLAPPCVNLAVGLDAKFKLGFHFVKLVQLDGRAIVRVYPSEY